jgi:hypothetical protein
MHQQMSQMHQPMMARHDDDEEVMRMCPSREAAKGVEIRGEG